MTKRRQNHQKHLAVLKKAERENHRLWKIGFVDWANEVLEKIGNVERLEGGSNAQHNAGMPKS